MKIGQAVSEKTFKDYMILYLYSPGTRADNQRRGSGEGGGGGGGVGGECNIMIRTKKFFYFIHTL